ncbi:DUF998 domain-containing protein [Promicromonospora sp. MS192]|uniref:DUF998 domain-containing protein n=1 Tax=Promicromonospora sp. MS192 TaxID=3412684 RepID=UPI003C2D6A8A
MLFIVIFLVSDAIKPGYDPVRDAVSEAAIGSGGWLQSTNFIVSGLLVAASSAAVTRAVGRWTGALVGVAGAGLALAGVFVSDPVPTEQASWHGMIHNAAGTASSAALVITCFVAARWRPTSPWRWYCLTVGVSVPLIFVAALGADETLGTWQRLTNIIGWTWLAALELRALSKTPSTDHVERTRA